MATMPNMIVTVDAHDLHALLVEFVAREEPHCRLDHNGFCQAHLCGGPCLVARAWAALAAVENAEVSLFAGGTKRQKKQR